MITFADDGMVRGMRGKTNAEKVAIAAQLIEQLPAGKLPDL